MTHRFIVSYAGKPVAIYYLWAEALEAARIEGFREVKIDQQMLSPSGEVMSSLRLEASDIRQDYEEMGA